MSALRWVDVADTADGDGIFVTGHRQQDEPGGRDDVRFVKGGIARALRTLRAAASLVPEDQVVSLSPQMVGGLQFAAAALGRRRRAAGNRRASRVACSPAGLGSSTGGRR